MSTQGARRNVTIGVGDRVVDREDDPRERSAAVVLDVLDEPAGEHYISALDATVADVNPDYPTADPVAVVCYEADVRRALGSEWRPTAAARRGLPHVLDNRDADVRRYSFPASRLAVVGEEWSRIPVRRPTASGDAA